MVTKLTTSGDGIQVVVAKAGTGKTFSVDACRHAWEASGHTVIGLAPSAKAAEELSASSGMPASTVDRWLLIQHDPLPRRTVIVIDEAGMLGTRKLDSILDRMEPDAKVVLVGDPQQLPSVDAGGTYRLLAQQLGAVELTENRRFQDVEQDRAADLLRQRKSAEAMQTYESLGLVNKFPDSEKLREQLVANWWSDRQQNVSTGMWSDRVRGLPPATRTRFTQLSLTPVADVPIRLG